MTLRCRLIAKGHLSDGWSEWFGGLQIINLPDGRAEMTGVLADSAALYAVIDRLRDLGMLLLALTCTPTSAQADDPSAECDGSSSTG